MLWFKEWVTGSLKARGIEETSPECWEDEPFNHLPPYEQLHDTVQAIRQRHDPCRAVGIHFSTDAGDRSQLFQNKRAEVEV